MLGGPKMSSGFGCWASDGDAAEAMPSAAAKKVMRVQVPAAVWLMMRYLLRVRRRFLREFAAVCSGLRVRYRRGLDRQLHRRQLHRRQLHRRQLHRRQLHRRQPLLWPVTRPSYRGCLAPWVQYKHGPSADSIERHASRSVCRANFPSRIGTITTNGASRPFAPILPVSPKSLVAKARLWEVNPFADELPRAVGERIRLPQFQAIMKALAIDGLL
ncbi:MAG: hypothetical protein DCC68_10600 [Planctomycetota bacterium]|nr:MAG: hypothetical protein DCC68_10600 [Planctomycetota bacterium]